MARASRVEPCMICEALPCECFAKKKPARAAKPTAPEPEAAPIEPAVPRETAARAAMRAAAAKELSGEFAARFLGKPSPRFTRIVDEGDAVLNAALRALEPIMHPEEKEKHRMILSSRPSLDERAACWRGRYGYQD